MRVREYNEQQLDWVRLRIFQAYSLHIKGKPLFDGTQYCVPASHIKRAKTKEERIEKELRGDLFQVKGRESRRGKSSMPLPPWAFEDSRVVRVVNALPDGQRNWIMYAYSDCYNWDNESGAVVALWKEFEPELEGVRDDTLQKLKGMAYLCVQDFKNIKNRGKPAHLPSRIRQLTGVPEGNWRRDWLPRWRRMQQILTEFDRAALAKVMEVICDRHVV